MFKINPTLALVLVLILASTAAAWLVSIANHESNRPTDLVAVSRPPINTPAQPVQDQNPTEPTNTITDQTKPTTPDQPKPTTTPTQTASSDLIIIRAPSPTDPYYQDVFDDIIAFDIAYANQVHGRDHIRIVVDEQTRPHFAGQVPDEVLLDGSIGDIWMRDFTTINPQSPVQFRYTAASVDDDQYEADWIQESFNDWTIDRDFDFPYNNYLLDGGNIVNSYSGRRVVTTERFLEDNDLDYDQAVDVLKRQLGAKQVAIIPADDPALAHSDGMVMFVDEDVLLVNSYDEPLRSQVLDELTTAFPGITIVEVPVEFDETLWDDRIGSACGINLNAVVTQNYIYMPHFGTAVSDQVMQLIQKHSSRQVVAIPAQNVCQMGGSVRCLSWQLADVNIEKFIAP